MLTESETISLFEAISVPHAAQVFKLTADGTFAVGRITEYDDVTERANARVLTHINELSAEMITRLKEYIAQWDRAKLSYVSVDAGSVSDLSGVTVDPEQRRKNIRSLILNIVPFWREQDRPSTEGTSTSRYIPHG